MTMVEIRKFLINYFQVEAVRLDHGACSDKTTGNVWLSVSRTQPIRAFSGFDQEILTGLIFITYLIGNFIYMVNIKPVNIFIYMATFLIS